VVISVVVFGLIVLNAIAVILKPLQEKEGISKEKKYPSRCYVYFLKTKRR